MRSLVLLFLFNACISPDITAQVRPTGKELYHYVFADFAEGTVKKRSGEIIKTRLNYNTITEEMIFEQFGKYLALDEIESIDSINLQGRTFVPANKVFYEVLTQTPVALCIQRITEVVNPGNSTGFGTTQTSAVSNLSSFIGSGGAYQLKLPDEFQLREKHEYWLRKYGGFISIKNFRQIEEVFPKKGQLVQEFVKANKLSFKNPADVIKLVQYCNS